MTTYIHSDAQEKSSAVSILAISLIWFDMHTETFQQIQFILKILVPVCCLPTVRIILYAREELTTRREELLSSKSSLRLFSGFSIPERLCLMLFKSNNVFFFLKLTENFAAKLKEKRSNNIILHARDNIRAQ